MEMNRSFLSKDYWKHLIIAMYSFLYMFIYTLIYPVENQHREDNNNRNNNNSRGGLGGGYNHRGRNVHGSRGGTSQFQTGMRVGGLGRGGWG